jgi:hypothetical protein
VGRGDDGTPSVWRVFLPTRQRALSGGAKLALADGPLLLATPTGVPAPTSGYLGQVKNGLDAVHLFGGPNALTDNVTTQLKSAL